MPHARTRNGADENADCLKLAVGAARLAFWRLNLGTGRFRANTTFYTNLGYRLKVVPSLDALLELTHPDDRAHFRESLTAHAGGTTSRFRCEVRLRKKNGDWKWGLFQGQQVEGAASSGEKQVVGIQSDVDQWKRTEEALRDSRTHLEIAVEADGVHLWEFDLATGRATYSASWPRALGYGPDEIEPTFPEGWSRIIHKDDLPGLVDAMQRHVDGHATDCKFEYRVRTKDGPWRWISGHSRIVEYGEGGEPRRLAGAVQDITERRAVEDALRESENRFRAAFEQAAVGMAHFSSSGHWTRVNRKFAEILGYEPEDLIGKHYCETTDPVDSDACSSLIREVVEQRQEAFQTEKRLRRQDGKIIWAQLTISSVRGLTGSLQYISAVCIDVTERKLSEARVREMQAQLRLAASIARLGFWSVDLRTGDVFISKEWKEQIGYDDGELPNREEEFNNRLHEEDWVRVKNAVADFLKTPRRDFEIEFRLRHKNGSYRQIASRMIVIQDRKGASVKLVGTHLDITERKEAEERARQAAQHDPLTGLPSRSLIYEFGEHLLAGLRRGPARAAVLFIDLDRFKPINDVYGHEVGDKLLQEVSKRLRLCIRGEDLVGRLGGDEFVAVVSHVREDEGPARAAKSILHSLTSEYSIDGLSLSISPSIGIAVYPGDGDSMEDLVKCADAAMYQTKESGRNDYCFFQPDLNLRAQESFLIESGLRRGLEKGEFSLYYQPVLNRETGGLAGVEALLRWPAMGVEPTRFIPVAETSGLMQKLGVWVIEEACRQQEEWRTKGLPRFPVAINISPIQFRQRDLLPRVAAAIKERHLREGDIHVEVTESTVMKNVAEAATMLHALRKLGVKVALDDFGTGYSSLSQLRWLPIDILKVDQSFVKNINSDPASLAIAEAIIALGNTLGLEIIAEGIESEATAELLNTKNCRLGQGFHYCKPLPTDEFEAWFWSHQGASHRPSMH